MKRLSFLLALLFIVLTTAIASAHRPVFIEPLSNTTRATAFKIQDHQISWAFYAQLTQPGEVNYYTFAGKRDETAYISVTLPKIPESIPFGLDVALISDALVQNDAVPFALNPGEHAVVAPDTGHDPDAVFLEPLTQTAYWVRQDMRVQLPGDGTYLIAVYNTQNKTGKYVLAVGEREEWRVSDLPTAPNIWLGVWQYFNSSNFICASLIILIAIAALAFGGVYYFTRNSSRDKSGERT